MSHKLTGLFACVVAGVLLAGIGGAGRVAAAGSGLVAAYGFDEGSGTSVADSSGTGNNGTSSNTTWTSGKYGGALSFNGSSSMVTIPGSGSLSPTGSVTVEAWVRPATASSWRAVAVKEQTASALSWGLYANSTAGPAALVYTNGEKQAASASQLAVGAWSHVAAVYSGSTLSIYVNGVLKSQSSVSGSIAESGRALRIGGDTIWNEWFQGAIDELRVYNRALTSSEIATDMSAPIKAPVRDTTAPSVPAGLTAASTTQSSVSLSWRPSSDNVGVTGYGVYVNGTLSGTTSSTSYTVSGLACKTTYTLAVDAVDAAGNRSAKASVGAATPACTDASPPTAPSRLAVAAVTATAVSLTWSPSSDNVGVAGYTVYDGAAAAGSTTSTSYTVSGLVCGTSHSLAVDAFDAAGNRSGKATVTATTGPCSAAASGAANLWVDTNGGTCTRQASGAAYADAQACSSFQAAYAAAQCGDVIGVKAGSYASQSITSGTKACTSSSQVTFTSVPGGTCTDNSAVSLTSISIGVAYVRLSCMNANPAGATSCANVSGASHTSVAWVTLDNMAIHCAFFDSDHLRVTNTTFGPDNTCATSLEDLVVFRANATNIDDVVFDHDTFATVTAPPDFQCGVGKHVDSMQGYGISNLVISNSVFYGCPGQCIIFRPFNGGTPGPIRIENTIFNQAQDPGQAIDIGSSNSADGDRCNGPIVIQNNTFVNGAAIHGGCWNGPSVLFRNNIFTSGSCGFGGSGSAYTNNVFYSGTPCGSSAKSCKPAYVGPSSSLTSPGDYHLAAGDTCAKGAAAQTAGAYASTDRDGQSRPQGTAVDAGVDEIP